jgi:hypothetical protein
MIERVRIAAYHQKRRLHVPAVVDTYSYRHDLVDVPAVTPGLPCEFRAVTLEQIALLHQVWEVPLEQMRKRLANGHRCFGVFVEGRIAHYLWLQIGGQHHVQPAGRDIQLAEHDAMLYHVRVAEWAQGKYVSVYGYTQALLHCRQLGCRTAWVYTTRDNLASQKSIERSGWVFDHGYRALRLGQELYLAIPGRFGRKP